MQALIRNITQVSSVERGAEVLITEIVRRIQAAGTDSVELATLATDLTGNKEALAKAVYENTPGWGSEVQGGMIGGGAGG